MTVINVLGSPGIGKSTFCAGLFHHMKVSGYDVEYVDEFAKHKVYEENDRALECQPFVFGNQLYKLHCLKGKVKYAITDSPIILSAIYNQNYSKLFSDAAIAIYKEFDSINLVLSFPQDAEYKDEGRVHTKEQSMQIQRDMIELLDKNGIAYEMLDRQASLNGDYFGDIVKKYIN